MSIEYKRRAEPPIVILTNEETGDVTEVALADFEGDPQQYVDAHLGQPKATEPSLEEQVKALKDALVTKGVVTAEEIKPVGTATIDVRA